MTQAQLLSHWVVKLESAKRAKLTLDELMH